MKTVAMLCALFLCHASSSAQEWSAAQKEVLSAFDSCMKALVYGNTEALIPRLHKALRNWDFNDETPIDRETLLKRIKEIPAGTKTVLYEARPVGITVVGNVAMVFCYHREVEENAKGERTEYKTRWMDVMVKDGGRWMMLGGHGGRLQK